MKLLVELLSHLARRLSRLLRRWLVYGLCDFSIIMILRIWLLLATILGTITVNRIIGTRAKSHRLLYLSAIFIRRGHLSLLTLSCRIQMLLLIIDLNGRKLLHSWHLMRRNNVVVFFLLLKGHALIIRMETISILIFRYLLRRMISNIYFV